MCICQRRERTTRFLVDVYSAIAQTMEWASQTESVLLCFLCVLCCWCLDDLKEVKELKILIFLILLILHYTTLILCFVCCLLSLCFYMKFIPYIPWYLYGSTVMSLCEKMLCFICDTPLNSTQLNSFRTNSYAQWLNNLSSRCILLFWLLTMLSMCLC